MLEKCKKVFRSLLKLSQLIDWRCILLNSVVRKAMSVPSGKLRVDVPEHGPADSPSTCQRGYRPGRAWGRLLYRVNIGVSSEPQSSVDDQRTFNVKAILEFHA